MRRTRGLGAAAACLLTLVTRLPASSADEPPEVPRVLWADPQQRGSSLAGTAELDGVPGAELLVAGWTGGFYAGRGDGSVLWRHVVAGWSRPVLIPDVTGDDRRDVAASTGYPGDDGELLVLSGATGEVLRRIPLHSPYGTIRSGDLNADGSADLVVPTVDGKIELAAFLGPDFATGWKATIPGSMNAYWVFGESLDVGNLDADPADEVVFGTRGSGNIGGKVIVLDGRTGAQRWSADTGSVFGVKAAAGRVVAFVWHSLQLTFRGELVSWPGSGGAASWTLPLAGHVKAGNMAVGDVDGDAQPEVVIGTTSAQEGTLLGGLDPSTTVVYAVGVADGRVRWASKVNRELTILSLVPRADGGNNVAYGTDAFLSAVSDEQVGLLSGFTGAPSWIHIHPSQTHDDAIQGVAQADVDGDGQPELAYLSTDHRLTALSPADGSSRFSRAYAAGVWTAADAGDLEADGELDVVGGGADGMVRAVRQDGTTRWTANVGGIVGGVRITSRGVLAVSLSPNARVVALDRTTGATLWSFATGMQADNPFTAQQQGFGDLDGDGVEDAVVGGVSNLRPSIAAVNGRTGTLLWRALSPVLPPGSHSQAASTGVVAVGVVGGDVAGYLAGNSRDSVSPRLVLLSGTGGAVRWSATTNRTDLGASFAALGDKLLVSFGDLHVSARSIANGTEAWTSTYQQPHALVPLGDRIAAIQRYSGLAPAFGGQILTSSGPGGSIAYDDLPSVTGAASVANAGVVVSTQRGIFVLDEAALRGGSVEVLHELSLIDHIDPNGKPLDVPSVTRVLPAVTSEGSFAVGLSDRSFLLGVGGQIPGAWSAQLSAS